jgi:hypothetical protein
MPLGWMVVVLVAVVVMVVGGVIAVWSSSRRWGSANRLHRLATRNESTRRVEARRALDKAVRALESVRRDCLASGHLADGERVDRLLGRVAAVRDRLASDYVPSVANDASARRELDLGCWSASENVGQLCVALAHQARGGTSITAIGFAEAESATTALRDDVARL